MPKIYIGRHWFNPETAHKWTNWPRKERLYMAIDQSDPELRWIRQPINRNDGDGIYHFISLAAARAWLAAAGQLEIIRSPAVLQALGLYAPRSTRLHVAASAEERECWLAAADAVCAESLSEWVRNQLNAAAHTEDRLLGIEERRLRAERDATGLCIECGDQVAQDNYLHGLCAACEAGREFCIDCDTALLPPRSGQVRCDRCAGWAAYRAALADDMLAKSGRAKE